MAEPSGTEVGRSAERRGRIDPEPARRYHLVVVGGGTAGCAAAELVAGRGARVALVERRALGGDRRRYAVPLTALARTSKGRRADDRGGAYRGDAYRGDVDVAAILERARSSRSDDDARAARLAALGVDIFIGDGRFIAADAAEVAGKRLRFRRALIATGARAAVPGIPGLDETGYLTSGTIFERDRPPRRLAVLGAGSRGCELAQTFAGHGSEVHLFDPAAGVLPRCEEEAAAIVGRAMRRQGVQLHLGSEILEVRYAPPEAGKRNRPPPETGKSHRRTTVVISAHGNRKIEVDEIFLATDRTADVESLGLEAAGVEYDLSGVEADPRLRTTNRRIFAAGSVVSTPGTAHDADLEARLAVRNALFFRRLRVRRRAVPRLIRTRPEIVRVGLDTEGAQQLGARVATLTLPLNRAEGSGWRGEEEGFLRLHLRRRSGRLLGADLMATDAAEKIAPLVLAIERGIRFGAFAETSLPYPTSTEDLRRAALAWRRQKRAPARTSLFASWFRLY